MNFSAENVYEFFCHYKNTYFPEHLQTTDPEPSRTSARIMVAHETDCSMIYISTKTILFRNNIANKNYVLGVHIADLISIHTLTAIPLSYYISVVRASSDLLQLL